MARHKKIDRQQVKDYLEQGYTVNHVAQLMSCTRHTISRIKHECDINMHNYSAEGRAEQWQEAYEALRVQLIDLKSVKHELEVAQDALIEANRKCSALQEEVNTYKKLATNNENITNMLKKLASMMREKNAI